MLDEKDKLILEVLQKDSRLSTYNIAKKTAIPQTTILNRMKKLKDIGIIKAYTIDLDWKKLDKNTKAIIFTKVNKAAENSVGEIEKRISKLPHVLNVKRLMGKNDFMVEVVCKDIDELNNFLIKKIRVLPEIADTETVVVLEEWEENHFLTL